MSQKSITSFYNSRKRVATEEIISSKVKRVHIERSLDESAGKPIEKGEIINKPTIPDKTINGQSGSRCIDTKIENLKKLQSSDLPSNNERSKDEVFAKKASTSNVANNEGSKDSTSHIVTNEVSKSEGSSSSRKELNLGDLKKKLASSGRLAEIRAAAQDLRKKIQQEKELFEKKNLKEFKSIDVDVPQSPSKKEVIPPRFLSPTRIPDESVSQERLLISPRKVVVSPVKRPNKVTAYTRDSTVPSTSLQLPFHFKFMIDLFRDMEGVVSLLYNRKEKITFKKLKPSIQEILKKNVTIKHLAQIKFLVPDFYDFEIEKIKNFSSREDSFELVITPIFHADIKVMTPTVISARRKYFYDSLLQFVKKHHSQFLATLDPPIVIPDDKLVRWHPEFQLENVPDVDTAKLPEIPNPQKVSSAQDVLSKARDLFKCNKKMERALANARVRAKALTEREKSLKGNTDILKMDNAQAASDSQSSKLDNATQAASDGQSSDYQILNPALLKLPPALLELFKKKQAAKALENMTRTTESEQKYAMYSRLPDLARTLRNIFVTERKNVLALNIILSKLESSFKSNVSANQLHKDIKLLTEESPGWLKLHEIRNTTYLKLDKNMDMRIVTAKLESAAQKYKLD